MKTKTLKHEYGWETKLIYTKTTDSFEMLQTNQKVKESRYLCLNKKEIDELKEFLEGLKR